MAIVIVKYDDSLDIDHRVMFWNGRRFVAEYPNAKEYETQGPAAKALKQILTGMHSGRTRIVGTICAVGDYGLTSEHVVQFDRGWGV